MGKDTVCMLIYDRTWQTVLTERNSLVYWYVCLGIGVPPQKWENRTSYTWSWDSGRRPPQQLRKASTSHADGVYLGKGPTDGKMGLWDILNQTSLPVCMQNRGKVLFICTNWNICRKIDILFLTMLPKKLHDYHRWFSVLARVLQPPVNTKHYQWLQHVYKFCSDHCSRRPTNSATVGENYDIATARIEMCLISLSSAVWRG